MIRQSILVILALCVLTIEAEPLRLRRRRRQITDTSVTIACPVACSWTFAQSWSKAISFEMPTANMIDENLIDKNNGTLGVLCSLYLAYRNCQRTCVASNPDKIEYVRVFDASPTYEQLCTDRQADFDSFAPCLSNNTKIYQRVCQTVNENLLAASVRLVTQGEKFDAKNANQFCKSADEQAYCIFPVLRQTCGDGAYDSVRSIVNASLTSIQLSVGPMLIDSFFPECARYFDTIDKGIDSPIILDNNNNQTTATSTVFDTTTTTTARTYVDWTSTQNSSLAVQRDDGNGTVYDSDRWAARPSPRLRTTTTTQSSGGSGYATVNPSSSNKFAFFFTTISIFVIFF